MASIKQRYEATKEELQTHKKVVRILAVATAVVFIVGVAVGHSCSASAAAILGS